MCRWLPWADFYWSCVSHFRGSDSENGWSGGNRLSLFVCSLAHTRVQVGMSLLSLVVTDESTGVVRVMRALRVLRIFGRLPSLRKARLGCIIIISFDAYDLNPARPQRLEQLRLTPPGDQIFLSPANVVCLPGLLSCFGPSPLRAGVRRPKLFRPIAAEGWGSKA